MTRGIGGEKYLECPVTIPPRGGQNINGASLLDRSTDSIFVEASG
jgi:hypothetical protein